MLQVLYYAYIKMSLIDRFHRLICKKCNKYFSERIITLQDIVGISKENIKVEMDWQRRRLSRYFKDLRYQFLIKKNVANARERSDRLPKVLGIRCKIAITITAKLSKRV